MIRTMLLGSLILLAIAARTLGQEPKKAADARAKLTYGGKPFAYWETMPRTELKAERRIDAIRALAAFGARGYAKEAAATIVEILKDYEKVTLDGLGRKQTADMTPDERVIHETLWALEKIGPDAMPTVVAHLDRNAIRYVAGQLYGGGWVGPIDPLAIPILVRTLQSRDGEARELATELLAVALYNDEASQAVFVRAVNGDKSEAAVVASLMNAKHIDKAAPLLAALGEPARAAIPTLVLWEFSGIKSATDALAKLKAKPADRAAALIELFKQRETDSHRAEIASKLVALGPDARAALPLLATEIKKPLPAANDVNGFFTDSLSETAYSSEGHANRMAMISAYVKLSDPKESLPVIAEMLDKNSFPPLEVGLASLYMKTQPDRKQIVAMSSKLLQRPRREAGSAWSYYLVGGGTRYFQAFPEFFVHTLGNQGSDAASAVPLLLKTFDKADDSLKLAIVNALGKIGPGASDALPSLTKLLQSPNADLRQAAAVAIEAIAAKRK